jgi:hypothetical protein
VKSTNKIALLMEEAVKRYPNDMELGGYVRAILTDHDRKLKRFRKIHIL